MSGKWLTHYSKRNSNLDHLDFQHYLFLDCIDYILDNPSKLSEVATPKHRLIRIILMREGFIDVRGKLLCISYLFRQ